MLEKYQNLYLAAITFGMAAFCLYQNDLLLGILGLFFSALGIKFIWWHFAFGPVFKAFEYIRQGRPERASDFLNTVEDPETLVGAKKGIYYLTRGLIEHNDD